MMAGSFMLIGTESTEPDWLAWWMIGALLICGFALLFASINLMFFRAAPADVVAGDSGWSVTVCIPARDEEVNLEACVRSILAAADEDPDSTTRVMVYDDGSTDGTPGILARLVDEDPRVVAADVESLPAGWNGKQHACDAMGRQATSDWVLFTDADVRFERKSLRRTRAALGVLSSPERPIAMLSAFPRERTGTIGESLVVPLIHVILLSYLPFRRMRRTLDPAASAACGQFILCRRTVWTEVGGHASIRNSMHDGVRLPRVFRRGGHATDVFDGADIVSCRMYRGFRETWAGFVKNAYEGLGSPILLVFLTVLHLGGHVAPWVVAILAGLGAFGILDLGPTPIPALALACAMTAIVIQLLLRARLARRFGQSWIGVPLHPIGLLMLTAIQWWSLRLHLAGRRSWRGRTT
ncbi:MAG: glycosyltransferase [Phycisphaera sp.]|nr:glycosyltransferase [Phycisphaera sp.]